MTVTAKRTVRVRNSTNKKQQILEVATAFFLTHGYDGSSISKMARESGISKESVYRYFDSKQHLFKAVIDHELEQYHEKVTLLTTNTDADSVRDSLLILAETLLSLLMTDRQQAVRRLIFNEIKRLPEIGRYYYKIGPELAYENLEKFFSAVQYETDFSPAELSHSFIALLLHDLMLQRSCSMCENPDADKLVGLIEPIVDGFLKAYFRV